MLGKTKKPENNSSFTVAKKEESKPAPPSPKPTPAPATSEEKTVIGEHILIEGHIKGQEHLVIEGQMNGNVEMEKHNFTVGSNGRVDGEIRAQNVSISGQLNGTISAMGKVEVTREADFFGEIKAKSISVEDGAYFKGSIELNREPHRKSSFAADTKSGASSDQGKTGPSSSAAAKKES